MDSAAGLTFVHGASHTGEYVAQALLFTAARQTPLVQQSDLLLVSIGTKLPIDLLQRYLALYPHRRKRLIPHDSTVGYSCGYMDALHRHAHKWAAHQWVLFLTPDTYVAPTAARALSAFLAEKPIDWAFLVTSTCGNVPQTRFS
jgi:hypothetical protein